MTALRAAARAGVAGAAILLLTAACAGRPPLPTADAGPLSCVAVEVLFARGTSQPPGYGRVGDPVVAGVERGLPAGTVRGYAVRYPAASSQDYSAGVADVREHVRAARQTCPATRFVLGGYSQGALVVAAALGAPVRYASDPHEVAATAPVVASVVVFGDPGPPLEASGPLAARTRDYCATDDAVCGRRGLWPGGHRDYPANGATDDAVAFTLARLRG